MSTTVYQPMVGATIQRIVHERDPYPDTVTPVSDRLIFFADNGVHVFAHHQDCCECVQIEDICGDMNDLIGGPIVAAESTSSEATVGSIEQLWTFFRYATPRGWVTVRWLGEDGGYYSKDVGYWHAEAGQIYVKKAVAEWGAP